MAESHAKGNALLLKYEPVACIAKDGLSLSPRHPRQFQHSNILWSQGHSGQGITEPSDSHST